jgi:hypothetical protein
MPGLAAQARQQPLPAGVLDVIRAAAGCRETLEEAVKRSGKDAHLIKSAAELYIQQVLLFPEADCYRILGVRPGASRDEMRTHMRWLMTWSHLDHSRVEWRNVFARRVLVAWREAGSAPVSVRISPVPASHSLVQRIPWVPRPIENPRNKLFKKKLVLAAVLITSILLIALSKWGEAGAAQLGLWIELLCPESIETFPPDLSCGGTQPRSGLGRADPVGGLVV